MLDSNVAVASKAIRSLLDRGLSEDEIHEIVTATAQQSRPRNGHHAGDDTRIYDELPDGTIDLPTAAQRYGSGTDTLRAWIRAGRICSLGRLRAPARGGGYHIVDESELAELDSTTPRRRRK